MELSKGYEKLTKHLLNRYETFIKYLCRRIELY